MFEAIYSNSQWRDLVYILNYEWKRKNGFLDLEAVRRLDGLIGFVELLW